MSKTVCFPGTNVGILGYSSLKIPYLTIFPLSSPSIGLRIYDVVIQQYETCHFYCMLDANLSAFILLSFLL